MNTKRVRLDWWLAGIVLAGIAIRLFQYPQQVLLDDEWHAIHQLLRGKSPGELFLSLGHADYSIPLGLLYWLEMRWFGLSEWAMRWPMLLAGVATLVLLPTWARGRFPRRVTLIFAGLLAVSPLLLIYSHTARPYALTLLLTLFGLYACYRALGERGPRAGWAAAYALCCALGTWLHAIAGPVLFAPLLLEGGRRLLGRAELPWRRLLWVGAPAALLTAVLVLPPLLAEPAGLALKTDAASVSWATAWGALHSWLGTPSSVVAVLLLALAALGLGPLLRQQRIAQALLLGLGLVLLAVLVLRPASVNHPLTFARYLLAALPLLLLATACGIDRVLQYARENRALAAALAVLPVVYLGTSPLRDLLVLPNSHVTHSRFQFDFRPGHNRIARYQRATLAGSAFWSRLSSEPRASLRIAAAPFYFETYHWDAPRWEQASEQRVRPAFLTGYCAERRFGEVPDDGRFPLRNAWWLSRIVRGDASMPDWLVFTRPIARFAGTPESEQMREEAERCITRLMDDLGPPDFDDDALIAWRLGADNKP